VRPLARLLYGVEIVGRVPKGAVVVAANHESVLDPPLLALTAEQPLHFLAKAELWRYPPGAWLMDALGGIPISRDRRDRDALRRGLELLDAGEAVAIFPEGTVRGGVWTRGAARLALAAGVPLVPVRIVDSRRALSRRRVGFPRIRLLVGEPIPVNRVKPTVGAARDLTDRVVASIHRLS
jgi:1-acyl-sn-glycerol-3-phosphate acyltransferase